MGYPEAGPSSDIADGLVWADWIYDAIVVGNASAWHAWWMTSLNNDNEGLLLMGGGVTKRLYTVGNYSKFIRPGLSPRDPLRHAADRRRADRVREPDRRNGGHRGHQQRIVRRSRSRFTFRGKRPAR